MYQGKKVVAICSSEIDQLFHEKLMYRVIYELKNMGYYTILFAADSDLYYETESDLTDASVFALIQYGIVDLQIVFSETIKSDSVLKKIVNRATEHDIPVISIGKEMPKCFNVIYDTSEAFEQIVRHVIEYHGVREVNFISGNKGNEIAEERLHIYQNVIEDNDILYEEERVGYGDFWFGPTIRVMDEFTREDKVLPEAIICANDSMAITVCDYLKNKGYHVPEDVIVTGFDGVDDANQHAPGITTCCRNEVMDAKSIAQMVQKIFSKNLYEDKLVLKYHVRLSQSCGCQKNQLFDSDALIEKLSLQCQNGHSNIRKYSSIAEKFLSLKTENAFWKEMGEILPENSFLCINNDLQYNEKSEVQGDRVFTETLNYLMKVDGEKRKGECLLKDILPEEAKNMPQDKNIILLPIHSNANSVGYFGIWLDEWDHMEIQDIVQLVLSINNSAAFRFAE